MARKKLEVGDTIEFTQKNGNQLLILVYEDCILVKAEVLGTDLEIKRKNSFLVEAKAISKDENGV